VLKEGKVDKNVNRDAFLEVEKEMRSAEIGDEIERLKLE